MRFLIVTGMSGAGKSHCVKYFEDLGFFCVDNLPPMLIPKFAELCLQSDGKMDKIALIIDIRGGTMFNSIFTAFDQLTNLGIRYEILFLDASDHVLLRRFKETRRMHPLSQEGRISDGIAEEREILFDIKEKSNYIIDTSNLTPRELKQEIVNIFVDSKTSSGMVISIISFGFKYGIPMDCDLVYDVRFLPNPFYIEGLKTKTGMDIEVRDYVLSFKETNLFLIKLTDMLDFLLPLYEKEGKTQLVIGIGCTGGKHRSVTIAKTLYERLKEEYNNTFIDHRDIEKDRK